MSVILSAFRCTAGGPSATGVNPDRIVVELSNVQAPALDSIAALQGSKFSRSLDGQVERSPPRGGAAGSRRSPRRFNRLDVDVVAVGAEVDRHAGEANDRVASAVGKPGALTSWRSTDGTSVRTNRSVALITCFGEEGSRVMKEPRLRRARKPATAHRRRDLGVH